MCWQGLCVVNENSTHVGFTRLPDRGPAFRQYTRPQAS